ncbi:MAG TPA: sigma 54-interacting transcriptional regulator [Myxococcales bacterium]|nr:sigma 54-interacting transcriptional regulator [Myxococcales bacterium]
MGQPSEPGGPGAIADVSTVGRRQIQPGEGSGPDLVPALVIAAHVMPSRVGERLLLSGLQPGRPVELSRNGPDFAPASGGMARPLADPFVSRKPVHFQAERDGAISVHAPPDGMEVEAAGQPVQGSRTFSVEEIDAGVVLKVADRVVLVLCRVDLDGRGDAMGMVGESAASWRLRRSIAQVADLEVPVLVRGETGSGKELVSQAIHQRSPRKKGPFIPVNLAAVAREVALAELFGARKGAFTGADRDRDGYFSAARGGTLFLDEVGEAAPDLQAMLLRVLETGEMFPVGSPEPVRADVRLVTATDANLEAMVATGQFKAPLLHRIAGYQISVPPLRARRADIGPLVFHFAHQELEAVGQAHSLDRKDAAGEPWMPAALAARLLLHPWPGNVRELRNAVRQLVIEHRGRPALSADARLPGMGEGAPTPPPALTPVSTPAATPVPRRKPSEVTEEEMRAALAAEEWDLKAAADRLGVPRSSMYDIIARMPGIKTAGALTAEEITRAHAECRGDLDEMARRLEVSRRALRRRVKELGLSTGE